VENLEYQDQRFAGQISFEKTPVVPAGSFGDAQVGATSPIDTPKLKHRFAQVYAQDKGAAAASVTGRVIHTAKAAGSVASIDVGITQAAVGAATVTVDLKKNGATILTGVVTINNSHAAFAEVSGTISSAAYALGDNFELVIVATAGGGTLPQGLYVHTVFNENP